MKTVIYTQWDQLPLMLNAEQVAQVLGISRSNGYALLHRADFPVIRIGKRLGVPKDMLLAWIDKQTNH